MIEGNLFSLYLTIDRSGNLYSLFNLSNRFSNVFKVADPKIFNVDDEVWITFNTGYEATGNNVYLVQVTPYIKEPKLCVYSDASLVEKNWAFFKYNGDLKVLYQPVEPIVMNVTFSHVQNEFHITKNVSSDVLNNMKKLKKNTIASPIVSFKGGLYFMSHSKFFIRGKRLYLGRLMELTEREGVWSSVARTGFLAHSARSVLGAEEKLNPNLISCTYFSGLFVDNGEDLFVSYGVNDLDFGIAHLRDINV